MTMIKEITDLSQINDDECLAGYRAGLGFIAIDYSQKSPSYWHGHHNGLSDRGLAEVNPVCRKLARDMLGRGEDKAMH